MRVLTGDIGGTNTRLMIVDYKDSQYRVLVSHTYPSNQYPGLQDVIHQFLDEHNTGGIQRACLAVAGPVINGSSKITNLPWVINEEQLVDDLKIPVVKLINDFTAVAKGVASVGKNDLLEVQTGSVHHSGSKHPSGAIIGAGTGLGVAHRVWIEGEYHIVTSETGHAGFAPETELQTNLLSWLRSQHGHVSIEMVLSGTGLYRIYQFLSDNNHYPESASIREQMLENDPARIITEYGLRGDDELCQMTLDTFVEIYGATAGNVALQYYPIDELYIAGGIAPRIKDKLKTRLFLDAFVSKGKLTSSLQNITVKIILDNNVGLHGALAHLEN
jgi:glucokinase